MILHVTAAEYRGGHCLWLSFDDGASGVADLADHLDGPVFEPLRDVHAFRRFRLDRQLRTVVWENGADLAPEFLRRLTKPTSPAGESSGRSRRRPVARAKSAGSDTRRSGRPVRR